MKISVPILLLVFLINLADASAQFRWSSAPAKSEKKVVVRGVVTDTSGNLIAGATIKRAFTSIGTAAGTDGRYQLELDATNPVSLEVSCVGYKNMLLDLESGADSLNILISLQPDTAKLDEVIVSWNGRRRGCPGTFYHRFKGMRIEPVDSIIPASPTIKVFPNPASRGSAVQLQIPSPGKYRLHLLDNNARLILQRTFIVTTKNQLQSLELPASLGAGMYHVMIMNAQTKASFTQKLVVQ